MRRTASGWWRAVNMMSSAPTNGIHVITESKGNVVMDRSACSDRSVGGPSQGRVASSRPQLDEDGEGEDAEGDSVDIVLRLPGLDLAEAIAGPEAPGAEDVQHPVHQVAVDPADQPGEAEQQPAVQPV